MFKDFIIYLKTILNSRIFKIARIVFLVFFLIALVYYHNEFFVLNRDKVILVPHDITLEYVVLQSVYVWGFLLSIVFIIFKRSRDWGLNIISVILGRIIYVFQSTKNLIETGIHKDVDEICTLLGVSVRKIWTKQDLTKIIEKWLSDLPLKDFGIDPMQTAEALYDTAKAKMEYPDMETMSFYTELYRARLNVKLELDAAYLDSLNQLTVELQTQSVYMFGTTMLAVSAISVCGYLVYLLLK